jgi:hypothetical protein
LKMQKRAHSLQLAAGLASNFQKSQNSLHFEDSLQLAAGFFNTPQKNSTLF